MNGKASAPLAPEEIERALAGLEVPEAFREATRAAAVRATYGRGKASERDIARLEHQLEGLGEVALGPSSEAP